MSLPYLRTKPITLCSYSCASTSCPLCPPASLPHSAFSSSRGTGRVSKQLFNCFFTYLRTLPNSVSSFKPYWTLHFVIRFTHAELSTTWHLLNIHVSSTGNSGRAGSRLPLSMEHRVGSQSSECSQPLVTVCWEQWVLFLKCLKVTPFVTDFILKSTMAGFKVVPIKIPCYFLAFQCGWAFLGHFPFSDTCECPWVARTLNSSSCSHPGPGLVRTFGFSSAGGWNARSN